MGDAASLPFELKFIKDGWSGRWQDQKLGVSVAGTEAAPHPGNLAAMCDVVGRWDEVKQAIVAFAAALPPDHHVPLEPASHGGFAARTCGFDQWFGYFAILSNDPDAPDLVEVCFDTGYPDGYAAYRIVLESGVPTTISAFAT